MDIVGWVEDLGQEKSESRTASRCPSEIQTLEKEVAWVETALPYAWKGQA